MTANGNAAGISGGVEMRAAVAVPRAYSSMSQEIASVVVLDARPEALVDPSWLLLPHHADLIEASGISTAVAAARGYRSVCCAGELKQLGFGARERRVPTLLIPVWDVFGEIGTHQHRPDNARIVKGKSLKYETPAGSRMVIDVPPAAQPYIGDLNRPLFITEGVRRADAAVSRGLCCIALLGMWNWRGRNHQGGLTALPDWALLALKDREIYIVFASDDMTKPEVQAALRRLRAFLQRRGAR